MSLSKYVLFFICLTLYGTEQHYSEKELSFLIATEYRTLRAQENILAQSPSNAQVKKSIEQTIARIKKRIGELECQREKEVNQ